MFVLHELSMRRCRNTVSVSIASRVSSTVTDLVSLPGLIDLHIHAPQYAFAGAALWSDPAVPLPAARALAPRSHVGELRT